MGVVKDGVDGNAKGGVAIVAVMPLFFLERRNPIRAAIRANRPTLPTNLLQMGDAIRFRWKEPVDLDYVHIALPFARVITLYRSATPLSTTLI